MVLASILTMGAIPVFSQEPAQKDSAKTETVQPQAAETTTDTLAAEETTALDDIAGLNEEEFSLGFHQQLKQKLIDGFRRKNSQRCVREEISLPVFLNI